MATPTPDSIRTVAVLGHSHDGKTTLCESLLHVAGATPRLGSTDQGTSILDADPEEHRRSTSITAAIATAVPIGSAEQFTGYVDLVDDRAYSFDEKGRATEIPLPESMREEVERAHSALVDAAAESDDALLEKYLEGTELTDDEVRGALHAAALRGDVVPIVPAAALS